MNKRLYINIILVLSSIVILVYVGLIPLGHWQTDEYQTALAIKNGGLDALKNRIATWSPRPLSESLIFIYLDFVNRTKNQLITPVLGLFWLMLISCTVMPVIIKSRNAKYPTSKILLIPLSLMGMYLLNHPVA